MTYMGEVLARHGSDKSTNHSYDPIYESLFPDRDAVKNVLEIGIASGQSVLAWREIFPQAQIVGFDKMPCHGPKVGSTDSSIYPQRPRPERLEIHLGEMSDYSALMRAVGGRKFDMIIEDASHKLDDNLRTLFWLWPYVIEGGYYVVEEMENAHSWVECLPLFKGVEIRRTTGAHPDEILVVIKK